MLIETNQSLYCANLAVTTPTGLRFFNYELYEIIVDENNKFNAVTVPSLLFSVSAKMVIYWKVWLAKTMPFKMG